MVVGWLGGCVGVLGWGGVCVGVRRRWEEGGRRRAEGRKGEGEGGGGEGGEGVWCGAVRGVWCEVCGVGVLCVYVCGERGRERGVVGRGRERGVVVVVVVVVVSCARSEPSPSSQPTRLPRRRSGCPWAPTVHAATSPSPSKPCDRFLDGVRRLRLWLVSLMMWCGKFVLAAPETPSAS